MNHLAALGRRLREARRRRFPDDDMQAFALRSGVARSTLQKMEQGDPGVALGRYYAAAEVLGLASGFEALFVMEASLFDDDGTL